MFQDTYKISPSRKQLMRTSALENYKGISNMYDYDDSSTSDYAIIFPSFPFKQYTFFSITSYLGVYANKLAFGLNW